MPSSTASASPAFRRGLADQLPDWLAAGILNEAQADALRQRYQLDTLGSETHGRFWMVIYVFGALLIGLGVIALVGSSWPFLPATIKVVLLLGAMIAVYALGYRWRYAPGHRPGLGHAMELLGVLLFGANIGLFGQIFHLDGSYTAGFGIWALGATAMAYATGSAPIATLALLAAFNAFAWDRLGTTGLGERLFQIGSLAAIGLPFSVWRRSLPVFALTLLGIAFAYTIMTVGRESMVLLSGGIPALGVLYFAVGVLLLARGQRLGMARVAMILGVLILVTQLYVLSFWGATRGLMDELQRRSEDREALLVAGFTLLFATGTAAAAARPALRDATIRPLAATLAGVAALTLLLTLAGSDGLLTLAANLGLVVLGGVLVWTGVVREARSGYWGGVLLLALLLLTRFMEYDTGLLIKGVAFIAAGLAVLYSGAKFEGYLDRRRKSHAA